MATYLERNVRNLLNVDGLRDFERFLRAPREAGALRFSFDAHIRCAL